MYATFTCRGCGFRCLTLFHLLLNIFRLGNTPVYARFYTDLPLPPPPLPPPPPPLPHLTSLNRSEVPSGVSCNVGQPLDGETSTVHLYIYPQGSPQFQGAVPSTSSALSPPDYLPHCCVATACQTLKHISFRISSNLGKAEARQRGSDAQQAIAVQRLLHGNLERPCLREVITRRRVPVPHKQNKEKTR